MLPSAEEIEAYFHYAESYVVASVAAVVPDRDAARGALGRLWDDVARFGPSGLAEITSKIPGLGDFELPPPPPPPPPPKIWFERTTDWVKAHRLAIAAVGTGVIGAGVFVRYAQVSAHRRARMARVKSSQTAERRQVIVVLGADHPLGAGLCLELERRGFIVVASVSSSDVALQLEQQANGYVRALVLDPSEPTTVPPFLRSLASTMSRRFPINTAGDPHASSATQAYVHAVLSLLPLGPAPAPAPLEHLAPETHLAYLQRAHLVPLHLLQSLLPLLRSSLAQARARDKGERVLAVCVPAPDSRVALPFSGTRAVAAAATRAALDVLRRELAAATLAGASAGGDGGAHGLRVVAVELGAVGDSAPRSSEAYHSVPSTEAWTPSERAAYGAAFAAVIGSGAEHDRSRRVGRLPTPANAAIHRIADVVAGPDERARASIFMLSLWRTRRWWTGDRVAIGAGARTYALASALPSFVLDALLNLPYFLIGIRNALLPIQPHVVPSRLPGPARTPSSSYTVVRRQIGYTPMEGSSGSEHEAGAGAPGQQPRRETLSDVETGSEADVESNTEHDSGGDGSAVQGSDAKSIASSWVQLDA